MKSRRGARAALSIAAVVAVAAALVACGDDDGASVRDQGSVVIIGPTPPGGGGSVSALGTGCVTKGATTRLPGSSIVVNLDEFSIEAPATVAPGVTRIVAKNFGAAPHELAIVQAEGIAQVPTKDGFVDEDALADAGLKVKRIAAFGGNTICEGTFDLAPGSYVLFGNQAVTDQQGRSEFDLGMATELTVA